MRIAYPVVSVVLLFGAGCGENEPQRTAGDEAFAVPAVALGNPAPETKPLACTISAEATCELGSAPKVTVAITSQGNAEIYLAGSLAGSDGRMRYPYCYFEVTGPDGKSAVPEFIPDDPFVNVLRERDFVKLPPGGTFDPYDPGHDFFSAIQLHPNAFRTAGEYRIRFVYSTRSDDIAEWRGDDWNRLAADEKVKILAMFKQVPKVEVKSNEITVTVVGPGK